MKQYIVLYMYETDGDMLCELLTKDQIKKLIEYRKLNSDDYVIIDGLILKNFNNKNFDINNLKD